MANAYGARSCSQILPNPAKHKKSTTGASDFYNTDPPHCLTGGMGRTTKKYFLEYCSLGRVCECGEWLLVTAWAMSSTRAGGIQTHTPNLGQAVTLHRAALKTRAKQWEKKKGMLLYRQEIKKGQKTKQNRGGKKRDGTSEGAHKEKETTKVAELPVLKLYGDPMCIHY